MTIDYYCNVNGVNIDKQEIKSFEEITKTNADIVFNNIFFAFQKYKIDGEIRYLLLNDVDAWFALYKNPEESIRKFMHDDGTINSNSLYIWAITD